MSNETIKITKFVDGKITTVEVNKQEHFNKCAEYSDSLFKSFVKATSR
jgi:hypothetical protein